MNNRDLWKATDVACNMLFERKKRYLEVTEEISLDQNALIPNVHSWTQLQGFRMTEPNSAACALTQAAGQWLRSLNNSGTASAFVLCRSSGQLRVLYGNMPQGILNQIPGCQVCQVPGALSEGYACSGIMLGTLASQAVADIFASAEIDGSYVACIAVPAADSMGCDLLQKNRDSIAWFTPYQSFQRVYGTGSRRTQEIPVKYVHQALEFLKQQNSFLEARISGGLLFTAVRFGARNPEDLKKLAALLQSGMHTDDSGAEPILTFSLNGCFDTWQQCLAVPCVKYVDGLSLRCKTAHMLSIQGVADAASFCSAPVNSCPGYYVDVPGAGETSRDLFPAVRGFSGKGGPVLGTSLNSPGRVQLPLHSMLSHTAVFGATNTGKTNVVMQVILQAWRENRIPFVVLEASKKEYSALAADIPELQVYTSGLDGLPLQLNPLQPENGVLIENHVAAVVSAISAATGAEHPIPEALSGLLRITYRRFGWEFGSMAFENSARPFPVFSDVLKDVDGYIRSSAQYGPEVRQNLTAALKLRCETFSSGALGRMFSKSSGQKAQDFLVSPSVIELADLSEESSVFLMNILLFKFQSFLSRLPGSDQLKQLIVVEEAHNIFRRTLQEESALARSNLAFDRLFAEVRASGTGMVLSDQRPSVMPDSVLANTTVKICLGMDSIEDRRTLGDAMNLTEVQQRELHRFTVGEALLSVRGYQGACHVRTDRLVHGTDIQPACMICAFRFRCRKDAVCGILQNLSPERIHYHMAKLTANPYNPSAVSANIECMLRDLNISASAATRLCLLGELLRRSQVPVQKSRVIVSTYCRYLKEGEST